MSQKTKIQHYVPQHYLRNFSNDGKSVLVFDKVLGKQFRDSIKRTCAEKDFFELEWLTEQAQKKGWTSEQFIEDMLTIEDTALSVYFRDLLLRIKTEKNFLLSNYDGLMLTRHIAWQHVRTKEFRVANEEFGRKYHEIKLKKYLESKKMDSSLSGIRLEPTDPITYHADRAFGRNLIEDFQQVFLRMSMIIEYSKSGKEFITSDAPIVHSRPGFAQYGSKIIFPLTHEYAVVLYDQMAYGHKKRFHRKLRFVVDEYVNEYNSLQVKNCYRKVISKSECSEFASELCRENPEITKHDRERVIITEHENDIISWSPIVY